MKEQMREAFKNYLKNSFQNGHSVERTFNAGYQAALSAVPAQEPEVDHD